MTRVMLASGTTKLMLSTMETMIAAQRDANPQIPAGFWDAFMAHARRDSLSQAQENLPPNR